MGSDTHANNIDTLNPCGDHTICLLPETIEQTHMKIASVGVYV